VTDFNDGISASLRQWKLDVAAHSDVDMFLVKLDSNRQRRGETDQRRQGGGTPKTDLS
jgi:hypothetical protein